MAGPHPIVGRLVGFLLDTARGGPLPTKPWRPYVCPRCTSSDICGERPCRAGVAWPAPQPGERDPDWHCHHCPWAVRW